MTHVADLLDRIVAHLPQLPRGWRTKHPTNKQRSVLVDRGYRVPVTRGEAAELIAEIGRQEGWARQ